MPRLDGTSPRGMGPMSGRGLGPRGSGSRLYEGRLSDLQTEKKQLEARLKEIEKESA